MFRGRHAGLLQCGDVEAEGTCQQAARCARRPVLGQEATSNDAEVFGRPDGAIIRQSWEATMLRFMAAGALGAAVLVVTVNSSSGEDKKAPPKTLGKIERLDPALDAIVAPGAAMEIIAEGFDWSEGPLWVREGRGIPALLGHPAQSDPQVDAGPGGERLPEPERIPRPDPAPEQHRARRAGVERPHPRSRGAARPLPARQPAGGAHGRAALQAAGEVRPHRRSLRGQAAQQPERPRLPPGRVAVLHRSALRPDAQGRRPGQAARLPGRLSRRPRTAS